MVELSTKLELYKNKKISIYLHFLKFLFSVFFKQEIYILTI